jgi:hypothetical protein
MSNINNNKNQAVAGGRASAGNSKMKAAINNI